MSGILAVAVAFCAGLAHFPQVRGDISVIPLHDPSGNLSAAGDDVDSPSMGWLLAPPSAAPTMRTFTLTINSLNLVGSDSLEIFARWPTNQGDRLLHRYEASSTVATPLVLTIDEPAVLVVLEAASNKTYFSLEYGSGQRKSPSFDDGDFIVVAWVIIVYLSLAVLIILLAYCAHSMLAGERLCRPCGRCSQRRPSGCPTKSWRANARWEEDGRCSLCMEAFIPGQIVLVLSCNHYYHAGCIDSWLASTVGASRPCPFCKNIGQPTPAAAWPGTAATTTGSPASRPAAGAKLATAHHQHEEAENNLESGPGATTI